MGAAPGHGMVAVEARVEEEEEAMRVSDVMSTRPIVVSSTSRRPTVRRLMEQAGVHHIPVVDDGRVAGVWLATREGPLMLLGPEHVDQTFPEADAEEAMTSLIEDSEAVLVWDAGVPAGIVTPTDLRALVRDALRARVGRRYPAPVVALISGPSGSGKTTLLMRTLSLLPGIDIGVVQGNATADGPPAELLGARAVDAPQAHWRSGLRRAVKRLAGAELILAEDLDGPIDPEMTSGEDLQVAVLDARDLAGLEDRRLRRASAVAICRADQAEPLAVDAAVAAIRERHPGLPVFVLAAGHDDRGLHDWAAWLTGQVGARAGGGPRPRGARAARAGEHTRGGRHAEHTHAVGSVHGPPADAP
jgi:CBS domain-containing protein/Ni2+-binding GTPase involved in maturation of urease and hydrogenase